MGLLEKATKYHEMSSTDNLTTTKATAHMTAQPKKTHKLSKLMKVFTATALLSLAPQHLQNVNAYMNVVNQNHQVASQVADQKAMDHMTTEFQAQLKSRVSYEERAMLAKLLYGEAGNGTDPVEVIHTVLNRMSSPLFRGDMKSIITGKNQYVGYDAKHPVALDYLKLIDKVVKEWEDNGCQPIQGCDRYYFVTGNQGHCNKFEISKDHQGGWVKHSQKEYAPLRHYCKHANRQARQFYANNKIDRANAIRVDRPHQFTMERGL